MSGDVVDFLLMQEITHFKDFVITIKKARSVDNLPKICDYGKKLRFLTFTL